MGEEEQAPAHTEQQHQPAAGQQAPPGTPARPRRQRVAEPAARTCAGRMHSIACRVEPAAYARGRLHRCEEGAPVVTSAPSMAASPSRSEERRVGKEWGARGWGLAAYGRGARIRPERILHVVRLYLP